MRRENANFLEMVHHQNPLERREGGSVSGDDVHENSHTLPIGNFYMEVQSATISNLEQSCVSVHIL